MKALIQDPAVPHVEGTPPTLIEKEYESFYVDARAVADSTRLPEFFHLNDVIIKACNPDCAQRYASAAELHQALLEVQKLLQRQS